MENKPKSKIFLPNVAILVTGFLVILFSVFNIAKLTLLDSTQKAEVLNKYENEYYVIGKSPTDLQIEIFLELSDQLKESRRDYNKIADLVAQSFAIDFFNLSNKDAPYDVGGLQYMHDPVTFNKMAHYEYYQNIDVLNNTYGKAKLPKVESVSSVTKLSDDYLADEVAYETYTSTVKFKYESSRSIDLSEYVSEVELVLVNNEGKIEIVEVKMTDEVLDNGQ